MASVGDTDANVTAAASIPSRPRPVAIPMSAETIGSTIA